MGRKLATACALATIGWGTPIFGLGLGDINAGSALNERLTARIPLLSVGSANVDNIRASLASPEAFERAGIERPFYLSKLAFEVRQDGSGQTYVEVTSSEPVKEPFLDFLVELRWPNGRLLREYTVLLDPPIYTDEPSGPAPAAPTTERAVASDDTATPPDQAAAAGARSEPAAPAAGGVSGRSAAPSSDGARTYGPVGANDTLYGIAQSVRPEDVTVNQAMLALLAANPDAFAGDNINRLQRGAVLRVPEREAMTRLSAAAATREVRAQMASWRGAQDVDGLAEGAGAEDETQASAAGTDGGDEAAGGSLKVVAPEEGSGEGGAGPAGEGDASVEARLEQLQNRLTVIEETNASLESENADLRQQLSSIREELAQKEAALNLRMEQPLAQSGAGDGAAASDGASPATTDAGEATGDEGAVAAGETVATGDDATADDPAAGDPAAEAGAAGDDAAPVVVADAADSEAASPAMGDETASTAAEDASTQEDATEAVAAGDGTDTATAPESGAADDATAAAEPTTDETTSEPAQTADTTAAAVPAWKVMLQSAIDQAVANARWLGLAAAGVLVLLMGLMMARRRRRAEEEAGVEGLPEVAPASAPMAAATGVATVSETAGDESPAPAVDPVAQADSARASGELERAQEILDNALGEDPDNPDLRYRLLQVLAERGDRSGFEAEAQVLHTQLESENDPLWRKTAELGRRIAPEHPLFSADDADPDDSVAGGSGSDVSDADAFDAVEEASSGDSVLAGAPTVGDTDTGAEDTADFDLDFDLDDEGADDGRREPSPGEPEEGETAAAAEPERTESPATPTVESAASATDEDDGSFDFDLDLDLDAESADDDRDDTRRADGAEDDDLGALDFELPEDLDTPGGGGADDDDRPAQDRGQGGSDAGGLDFSAADEEDDEDLDDLDQAGTKLDLARAYLDMGDPEGARSLLEEVVEEGDSSQKEQAEELLQRAS